MIAGTTRPPIRYKECLIVLSASCRHLPQDAESLNDCLGVGCVSQFLLAQDGAFERAAPSRTEVFGNSHSLHNAARLAVSRLSS